MSGSIGAVACSFVKGECQPLGQRVAEFQTPGHSGYGASKLGLGNAPFRVSAIMFGFEAALNTWRALVQATQGTVVTITNDRSQAFASCLITRVGPPQWKAAKNALSDYRVEIPIDGVRTA